MTDPTTPPDPAEQSRPIELTVFAFIAIIADRLINAAAQAQRARLGLGEGSA